MNKILIATALVLPLLATAARADSESYPQGVSRPIESAPSIEAGSEAYPTFVQRPETTVSNVAAVDTGSEATPSFTGLRIGGDGRTMHAAR